MPCRAKAGRRSVPSLRRRRGPLREPKRRFFAEAWVALDTSFNRLLLRNVVLGEVHLPLRGPEVQNFVSMSRQTGL